MKRLLTFGLSLGLVAALAAPAVAAPKFDLVAGSGTWSGGSYGNPTLNVTASHKRSDVTGHFTFDYKEPAGIGETVYLVQGDIVDFSVEGTSACLIGEVTKEQGQDPADANNERFEVGEYVAITIVENGPTSYQFNFTPSDPNENAPQCGGDLLTFDAGTADFAIFDAG